MWGICQKLASEVWEFRRPHRIAPSYLPAPAREDRGEGASGFRAVRSAGDDLRLIEADVVDELCNWRARVRCNWPYHPTGARAHALL